MTTKKKPVDKAVIIAAIAGLVIIECIAMSKGINGTFRMIITTLIAGLAGIVLPTPQILKGK